MTAAPDEKQGMGASADADRAFAASPSSPSGSGPSGLQSHCAAFTPGPWEIITVYSGPTAFYFGGEGEPGPFVHADLGFTGVGYGTETIALCPSQEHGVPGWLDYQSRGGDHEANARLIAAAPDGYALAEWIDAHWADQDLGHADFRVKCAELARAFIAKARGER